MFNISNLFSPKFEARVYRKFNSHYKKLLLILTESAIAISDGILADTLVLCHMFATSSVIDLPIHKEAAARKTINHYVYEIVRINNISSLFEQRYQFYEAIILDKITVRADYWIGSPPDAFLEDPNSRCILAYGDMLRNPDFFDDYENAPILLEGIVKNASFMKDTLFPIHKQILKLQSSLRAL